MSNGQVLTELWSKKIWKKNLLSVAYNTLIFPTNTISKKNCGLNVGKTSCDTNTHFAHFNF